MKQKQTTKIEIEKILVVALLLFFIPLTQATPIDDLINSYSFDYYSDSIDVINVTDSITDTNSNSIDDRLNFSINISSAITDTYTFYIDLEDGENIVSNKTASSVSTSGGVINVYFSTLFLSGTSHFNYTLRVYDANNFLVHKDTNFETSTYSSYEEGYSVLGVTDSNNANTFIDLNVSLNVSSLGGEGALGYNNFDSGLKSGLVSYYELEETSGAVLDLHGSNDGTNYGSTRGVAGKINNGFSFDGAGQDYVTLFTTPQNGSVSMWVYFNTIPTGRFNFYSSGSAASEIMRIGYKNSGNPYFNFYDGGDQETVNTSMNYTTDKWYHIVAEWGTEGMKLYIDRILVATHSYTGNGGGDQQMNIGHESNYANVIDGKVDEVGIWNRSLSENEIQSIYNSVSNVTENISIFLQYGDKFISTTSEESLSSGINYISLQIDNETIKSTHHNGAYNLTSISIGSKLINLNYITNQYNYETFSKTSYFSNYSSSFVDLDSNDLIDHIEFNFTIESKQGGTYTIEADIYDLYDNYLTTLVETFSLGVGEEIVSINLNGSLIYSSYLDGQYKISFSRLIFAGEIIDFELDSHVTNIVSYYDFERPPLPDLEIVSIITSFDGSNTTLLISVKNSGDTTAFNVLLDVFNDGSYQAQQSHSSLDLGHTKLFGFEAQNTLEQDIFVAIVDFENLIDENNESNNFISNKKLEVLNLINNYADNTETVSSFFIQNNNNQVMNNLSWKFETGESNITSNNNFSLDSGKMKLVIVEHNYSSIDNYTVRASAKFDTISDWDEIIINL